MNLSLSAASAGLLGRFCPSLSPQEPPLRLLLFLQPQRKVPLKKGFPYVPLPMEEEQNCGKNRAVN